MGDHLSTPREFHLTTDGPEALSVPSSLELALLLILVTLTTASPLEDNGPEVMRVIKVIGYCAVGVVTLRLALPYIRQPKLALVAFRRHQGWVLVAPLAPYFLGLILGALHGPQTLYSLWQTFSDVVVVAFAAIAFGFLARDPERSVRRFLPAIAIWCGVVLAASLVVYLGNTLGWWVINPYFYPDSSGERLLMNGPFYHANVMGYFLMTGAFAAGALTLLTSGKRRLLWLALGAALAAGTAVTFARGAMLGLAAGLLFMLASRRPKLALGLSALAAAAALLLTLAVIYNHPVLELLPKTTFAGRLELWQGGIEAAREIGPLGAGAGQAVSAAGWAPHNLWIEQYMEGGVLTTLGALAWLILPLVYLRRTALDKATAWAVVAAMLGLMVHGIFWSEFLNGLRFFTLVYVCLWAALATAREAPAREGA
jgi:O-antigen ligase